MTPDQFIDVLNELRVEIQRMHGEHVLIRHTVDELFKSAMDRIDTALSAAYDSTVLAMSLAAKEARVSITQPEDRQNRYFGTVIQASRLGILIKYSENHAVFIQRTAADNVHHKPGTRVVAERNEGDSFTVKTIS